MVIYTPMIFEWEIGTDGEERKFTEIPYGQATVIAEIMNDGVCRVERLISSNPDDYLHPDLQPGSQIMFQPSFQRQI